MKPLPVNVFIIFMFHSIFLRWLKIFLSFYSKSIENCMFYKLVKDLLSLTIKP